MKKHLSPEFVCVGGGRTVECSHHGFNDTYLFLYYLYYYHCIGRAPEWAETCSVFVRIVFFPCSLQIRTVFQLVIGSMSADLLKKSSWVTLIILSTFYSVGDLFNRGYNFCSEPSGIPHHTQIDEKAWLIYEGRNTTKVANPSSNFQFRPTVNDLHVLSSFYQNNGTSVFSTRRWC